MWLQYRRVGRWRSYLFGEKTYIILSLVAKSLLAWQVFAGTLAGCDVSRARVTKDAADRGPREPSTPGHAHAARGRRPTGRPLHDRLPVRPAGHPAGPEGRRHLAQSIRRPGSASAAGCRSRRPSRPPTGPCGEAAAWTERSANGCCAGDIAGSWQVVEAAMASGLAPPTSTSRSLAPALHAIGEAWGTAASGSSRSTSPPASRPPSSVGLGRGSGGAVAEGDRHRRDAGRASATAWGSRCWPTSCAGTATRSSTWARIPRRRRWAAMRDADRLAAVVISVVDAIGVPPLSTCSPRRAGSDPISPPARGRVRRPRRAAPRSAWAPMDGLRTHGPWPTSSSASANEKRACDDDAMSDGRPGRTSPPPSTVASSRRAPARPGARRSTSSHSGS